MAGAFMAVDSGLLSLLSHSSHVPRELYGFEVVLRIGLGSSLVAALLVIKLYARKEDSAAAQGLLSESRILGGNAGLAIFTIVLNARLSGNLKTKLTPQQLHAVQSSLNSISELNKEQQIAIRQAFARASQTQFWICIGIGAIAVISGVMLWQRDP